MSPTNAPTFRVIPVGLATDQIRSLHRRAAERRLGSAFLHEISVVQNELSQRPAEWGDIRKHLQTLGLDEY